MSSLSSTHEERPRPAENTPLHELQSSVHLKQGSAVPLAIFTSENLTILTPTLKPFVIAESPVATTIPAWHSTMVRLRPAASESPPRETAPAMTPPMNRLMVSGDSQGMVRKPAATQKQWSTQMKRMERSATGSWTKGLGREIDHDLLFLQVCYFLYLLGTCWCAVCPGHWPHTQRASCSR